MERLSKPQRLIYDMEKFHGGSISVICGSIVTKAEYPAAALTAAVNELYHLNDALRIRIVETDSGPMQEIKEYVPQEVKVLHFESKAELDAYADRYAKIPIDLYGPLCELTPFRLPGGCGLLAKLHHMVGDAWTLALIGSQFNALLNGEAPEAYSYAEYLEREDEYLKSGRYEKDRAYFLERFKTCDEVTFLSEKRSEGTAARRKTYVVGPTQAQRLNEYAKRHNASAFTLFMTAAAVYLSRVRMNPERFYIGTAVLNRAGKREKNTAGMFVNTAPLLIELSDNKTFGENLEQVKSTSFEAFRHQKYNYGDLLAALRRECGFTGRLYDVMVSYQNAAIAGETGGFESTWYHSGAQTESLQIHIDDRDGEGIFRIHFDYQTEKFTEAEIDAAYTHMMNLLFGAVEHEDTPIRALEMLSQAERHKLLLDFNDTAVDYPREKCVHRLFEEQVEKTPDKTAVVACDGALTYRELNEVANRIAHGLIAKGVRPGDIVAFSLHRTSRLIAGMFGILKAGAAYLPMDLDYPQERIDYMLSDSGAKLLLTDDLVEELLENGEVENPAVPVTSENLCYCIYTSGSTGKPKGSFQRHRNLVNFCTPTGANNLQQEISDCCNSVLAWGSISFDISIFEIVLSLTLHKTVVLASEQELGNPALMTDLIKNNRIDCIHATPTKLLEFLKVERFSKAFQQVKCIMVGGERFSGELQELLSQFNAKIFNGYGPTETTCGVCFGEITSDDITIGKPIANTQIYIVDKHLNPVPMGVTGELSIAGNGVGAGYLNRPELTAEKFIDNPFGPGKLYKTGDLAYWRKDGNIVYVGRSDFQVKVRGLRIELGEIEAAISAVEGISQAVVVVRKDDTGRQLICAFYTETKPVPVEQIKSALREKLPRYMTPHVFSRLDALPMTPSGKIDRKSLPEVDFSALQSEVEYVAPEAPEETALTNAIQAVLGVERVGLLDNFFDLGGDSLKAIELIAKLEKTGLRTDTKTIFACETVKELAAALENAVPTEEEPIPAGDIPATAAQLRVYTAQNMQGGTAYNVPYVFKAKSVDPERLERAVNQLIDRHEILRTHFENRDGEIMQVAEDSVPFTLERLESGDVSAFVRPFDLSKAPLLRVGYFENTVMVDMHHIITDGGSMPAFLRELNELYMGRELTHPPVQYRAFAAQKQDMSAHEDYWLSVYREELLELALNTDFKRDQKQSFRGATVYDSLDGGLHSKIVAKCKALNVTPYVFYLGGFYILLSKFSGNEDIAVGTPASGREGRFLNTLGMFVNTLAIRSKPEGDKSVRDFLGEVKESSLAALEHQAYPYGDLVKKLGLQAQGRNPLFDVMFAYQSESMTTVTFGDQSAELLPVPVTTAKYDFTFNVLPRQDDVVLMAEYCADLYKEQTIQRLLDGYKLILTQMLSEGQQLKALSAMTETEKRTLLVDFNDTAVEYPREKCVHQLFEEQAEKTPDKTAVVACDRTLTYRELNEAANRIAHGLIAKGIRPGDIVAFALHRTGKLIAAMFGILKAGAAYLPIDLDYPQERINYMLSDSGAKLLLTDEGVEELLKNGEITNPAVPMTSESLCYCIYTSGTTGNPKGVLIRHRNLLNFCLKSKHNTYQKAVANKNAIVLSTFKQSFDAFEGDSILPLLNEGSLILVSDQEILDSKALKKLIVKYHANVIQTTPSVIRSLYSDAEYRNALKQIKVILLAAENVSPDLPRYLRKFTNATIFNGYGPSETTIGVSYTELRDNNITIGKPISNTQIYIVDKYLNPVPMGVTGELCIAGDGVGAGYLNRPELTAEKFIDNPFGLGKLYKTGDLAFWREDGNIAYVGRSDFQVKVRGLRIELGEIEAAISTVDGISQAVVVVRKDDTGRQLICAFYTETKPVPVEQIKSALREKLPRYMTPHVFTRLDTLPMTPGGKIDRKALPEVDLTNIQSDTEYIRPEGELEIRLAAIMEQILHYAPVGREDNFFDLGGDSLKAIEFISKAHSEGIYLALQSVFDHPTVAGLAQVIQEGDRPAVSYADVDFTGINRILAKNQLEGCAVPQETEVGNLLLAGATGFLGIHILADFLEHDSGTAYCLVRGKDQADSESRMVDLLRFYFGEKYIDCDRIRVLRADLREERFGLTEEDYGALCGAVDTVINAAASVKHYGSYQYFKEANVDMAERLIRFCQGSGAKLLHISTLSVSGNGFDTFDGYVSEEEKHFYEHDLYIGQPLDNVYARSKFEAERAVLEAMGKGLRANIFRMGNLTSRLSDGVFQKNYETNAFLKRVKALLELGIIPDYLMPHYVEFTPIDEATAAVMTIARHFSTEQTVFHINSTKVFYMKPLIEYCRELGYPIEVVSGKEFAAALRKTMEQSELNHIFETFINDLDANDQLAYDSRIRIENQFTEEYLRRLGFAWAELGVEYMRKYVSFFRGNGYFVINDTK